MYICAWCVSIFKELVPLKPFLRMPYADYSLLCVREIWRCVNEHSGHRLTANKTMVTVEANTTKCEQCHVLTNTADKYTLYLITVNHRQTDTLKTMCTL